jgi:hypothetical protein
MKQSHASLYFDQLIVGGSLEALELAHRTGLPILSISQPPPAIDFSRTENWRHLSFVLSLAGQLPLSDNLSKVRFNEGNSISCFTNNSRIVEISYGDAYIVDDHNVAGLPTPIKAAKKEFLVLDWISVRRGQSHDFDYLEDKGSNFVKKLVFYPSERIAGKRSNLKDACAISTLTEKQLKDLDYSETYVFLKSRDMMKKAGIKGSRNGTQAYNGKPAYLSIKLETAGRDVFPLHKNVYENTGSIHFNFDLNDTAETGYNKRIERFLENIDGRREPRGR